MRPQYTAEPFLFPHFTKIK